MGSLTEGLLRRVNERTQRRFHAMVVEQSYADPTSRSTRLYKQAERLMDAIENELAWQASRAEWDRLQLDDPEAPVYPPAFIDWNEVEIRAAFGDR